MTQPKPPDLTVEDDGLPAPEVGPWSEEKYRLLWYYADLFARSMKEKWERVYLDLFSGAGYARLKGTSKVVLGSPLLALRVRDPFDRYVFCEESADLVGGLRKRVARIHGDASVAFIHGDANDSLKGVFDVIPRGSRHHPVLTFCFVDPFKLGNLRFETIKRLSERYMDFLVNIPAMDPIRNEELYFRSTGSPLDGFLGNIDWRARWDSRRPGHSFEAFVAEEFDRSMRGLGFGYGGFRETVMVRTTGRVPLYRLGFFSRNALGERFWKEARKYSDPQRSLFADED